jgi:MFS family permease
LALPAVRHREFRYLWIANTLFTLARWFELAVLAWLALALTGSSWQMAVIGFWRYIPMLPLGPAGGVLADHVDRRRIVVLAQLGNALIALAIGGLLISGQLTTWHLLASSLLLGLIIAVDFPCRRALVAEKVERQDVVNATALESASEMVSRVLGPLVGGSLIALLGVGGCYVVLAALYATAGLVALRLRPAQPRSRATVRQAVRSLVEGLRYAARRPDIHSVLGVSVLSNLLAFPFLQFLPVFARDVLALDAARYGTLGAAVGLGALVSSLVMAAQARRWRPGVAFLAGALVMGLGLLPFALATSYGMALLSLLAVGVGTGLYVSLCATVVLVRADPAMHGRLMGLLVLGIGLWLLGMLVLGALIEQLGTPWALALTASAYLLGLLALATGCPQLYRGS